MGFFKDVKTLKEMGREELHKVDMKATMANGMAQMQAMNDMAASSALAVNGVEATASITAVRQTGSQINFAPVVELDLLIFGPAGAPYPVTRRETVQQIYLARAQPGQLLKVKVDPNDNTVVRIDWITPA